MIGAFNPAAAGRWQVDENPSADTTGLVQIFGSCPTVTNIELLNSAPNIVTSVPPSVEHNDVVLLAGSSTHPRTPVTSGISGNDMTSVEKLVNPPLAI